MNKKYLVTSALPYVNGLPHLGHIAGCLLPADVYNRFQNAVGNDSIFICGTDDHGTASFISAREIGVPIEKFIDVMNSRYKEILTKLNIKFNNFSRTSTATHEQVTKDFFKACYDNGYISEKESTMIFCEKDKMGLADRFVIGTCPYCGYDHAYGDQCDNCGKTYELEELINPKCSFCGGTPIKKQTKHLYLELNKVSNKLNDWIESQKSVWRPHVYAMAKRWINEGLKPRCITRDIPWGIKVPLEGYEDKVFYVWFDAPIGYISMTKELGEDVMKDRWQNPDCKIVNFIGKDNIDFHAVMFPSQCLACGKYELASNVAGFNFLNFEGKKFSKSKRIGIFGNELLNSDIDIDALRAYLVSVFPENKDSEFTYETYKNTVNADLVGKFGNFFNRTLSMNKKNFDGKLGISFDDIKENLNEFDKEMVEAIKTYPNKIIDLYDKTEFRCAETEIMHFASIGNTYLEKVAPWNLIKNGDLRSAKKTLYLCLNMAKSLALLMAPICPDKCQNIYNQLGFNDDVLARGKMLDANKINISANHEIGEIAPLFARVDDEMIANYKQQFNGTIDNIDLFTDVVKQDESNFITIDDFCKVQMKVGLVLDCEAVPKSKLLHSTVRVGDKTLSILSGIGKFYTPEEMKGKKVIVVVNLPPREMKGLVSEGMIICAEDSAGNISLISPEKDVQDGSDIS